MGDRVYPSKLTQLLVGDLSVAMLLGLMPISPALAAPELRPVLDFTNNAGTLLIVKNALIVGINDSSLTCFVGCGRVCQGCIPPQANDRKEVTLHATNASVMNKKMNESTGTDQGGKVQ